MFHTHTHPSISEPLPKIVERVALPLLFFAGALFALLFISWFSILPRFTHFQISPIGSTQDETLSPTEMANYAKTLRAQLSTMEEKRDRLVLPIIDPSYDALKEEKRTQMNLMDIRSMLLDTAAHIADASQAVSIVHLSYDPETHVVAVKGDVAHVGPRSMTVLAQYVDALEHQSMVTSVMRPSFTREQDAAGEIHSPFSLQFVLQQP